MYIRVHLSGKPGANPDQTGPRFRFEAVAQLKSRQRKPRLKTFKPGQTWPGGTNTANPAKPGPCCPGGAGLQTAWAAIMLP